MSKLIDIPEGTDIIETGKKVNKLLSGAGNSIKSNKCILCGKSQTSFCNSQSIPQLLLKNVAENGRALHAPVLMGIDVIDIEKGC